MNALIPLLIINAGLICGKTIFLKQFVVFIADYYLHMYWRLILVKLIVFRNCKAMDLPLRRLQQILCLSLANTSLSPTNILQNFHKITVCSCATQLRLSILSNWPLGIHIFHLVFSKWHEKYSTWFNCQSRKPQIITVNEGFFGQSLVEMSVFLTIGHVETLQLLIQGWY